MHAMIGVEKTEFTPEQIAEYLADHYEAIVEYVKNTSLPRKKGIPLRAGVTTAPI